MTGSAVPSRVSLLILPNRAESGTYSRDFSRFRRRRPFMYPATCHRVSPDFIGSHATAYRWRSLPRVRRHRASSSRGSSDNGCCLCITMDQLMCASHFPPHYTILLLNSCTKCCTRVWMYFVRGYEGYGHHIVYILCVCVFFPSILDIKFVGRTSRGHTGGRSHRIFNPPSFCGACLDFCREKDSAIPFPRRP